MSSVADIAKVVQQYKILFIEFFLKFVLSVSLISN